MFYTNLYLVLPLVVTVKAMFLILQSSFITLTNLKQNKEHSFLYQLKNVLMLFSFEKNIDFSTKNILQRSDF